MFSHQELVCEISDTKMGKTHTDKLAPLLGCKIWQIIQWNIWALSFQIMLPLSDYGKNIIVIRN